MARVNIEDSIWADPKFLKLCIKLGDEQKAIGMLVIAWRHAQKYWFKDRRPIPYEEWESSGLPKILIELGFAKESSEGVFMSGSESHFSWKEALHEKSRKGGIASAKRQRDEKGRLLPKLTPSEVQVDPRVSSALTLTPSLTLSLKNKELKTKKNKKQTKLNTEMRTFVESQGLPSLNSEKTEGDILPVAVLTHVEGSGLSADVTPPAVPSTVGRFMGTYVTAFQKRYGSKTRPAITGKILGEVKRFLQFTSIERACDLIEVYFQMDDKWFETKNHDFTTFTNNLDKIGVALDTGQQSNGIDWSKVEAMVNERNKE